MATEITNYKCPACTGPLHFAGSSGKLECEYCGSSYSVEEMESRYAEKLDQAAAASQAKEEKADAEEESWGSGEGLKSYSCPSCGAELICDENTAATSCPYCGNPSIIPGVFQGGRKPDFVLPFKLDKKAAKDALKAYYKGKKLLPKSFSRENHLEEIKGVYVPFWLFSGNADGRVTYLATRVHSHERKDERVTITEHYRLVRDGCLAFEKIPVDASSKMPDNHMDAIEPFDYAELTDFSTAYLAGYLADKYDVEEGECRSRAKERASNTIEQKLAETTLGYIGAVPDSRDIQIDMEKAKYVLLPVWMLSTRWKGKNFLFAMNGQTGRLIGDLPISKSQFLAWFLKISLPMMAILGIISIFF